MSDLGLCHDYIIPAFFPIIPSNVDTSFYKIYSVFQSFFSIHFQPIKLQMDLNFAL